MIYIYRKLEKMGKSKKNEDETVSLISEDPNVQKPRLIKLIVKNFRCIGSTPVSIDLNDIVVLVGANNVGKSTILKAYEVAMKQGSGEGKLKLDDFPNNKIDKENLPEIELHTIVYVDKPGKQWIENLNNGERLVKERWVWENIGDPKRQGWNVQEKEWSDNVPWGAPNIANSRRPEPHRVDAFDSPEDQTNAIKKLLKETLTERIKNLKNSNKEEEEENDYNKLITQVKEFQKKVVSETQEQIDQINKDLTSIINKVFPNYKIDYDAKPEDELEKTLNLFKSDAQLLMGPNDGYLSSVEKQGSGARRTLLWTALKYISENKHKDKNNTDARPHLLLIDEPEICLHPNAIRDASSVLYDLPNSGNWQVMATTHSPIFIDFSRDNTTIIKVEINKNGEIQGTTVFRPDKVSLDDDDKKQLKLLNLCDPYVAEFFFGGKVVIVEGDTEYTAFNYIKAKKPEDFKNVHIIRARDKATIVSLVKILNQFGSNYSILHDSDKPYLENGNKNPAWSINKKILDEINKSKQSQIRTRLLASLPNFEQAYFDDIIITEKPYNALITITSSTDKYNIIEKLFKALIDFDSEYQLPQNCIEWSSMEDLEKSVNNI